MSVLYRLLRRGVFLKAITGTEPFYLPSHRADVQILGSDYGQWAVDAAGLGKEAVVCSFGLGTDITFETALIEKYGCTVHGFDPTPESIKYLSCITPQSSFSMHGIAITDCDGTIVLKRPPPQAKDQVSRSAIASYEGDCNQGIPCPALSLNTIRQRYGIDRLDILKLDIEGLEYRVLDRLLNDQQLDGVSQLLVEFHHFLPGITAR